MPYRSRYVSNPEVSHERDLYYTGYGCTWDTDINGNRYHKRMTQRQYDEFMGDMRRIDQRIGRDTSYDYLDIPIVSINPYDERSNYYQDDENDFLSDYDDDYDDEEEIEEQNLPISIPPPILPEEIPKDPESILVL